MKVASKIENDTSRKGSRHIRMGTVGHIAGYAGCAHYFSYMPDESNFICGRVHHLELTFARVFNLIADNAYFLADMEVSTYSPMGIRFKSWNSPPCGPDVSSTLFPASFHHRYLLRPFALPVRSTLYNGLLHFILDVTFSSVTAMFARLTLHTAVNSLGNVVLLLGSGALLTHQGPISSRPCPSGHEILSRAPRQVMIRFI